MESISEFKIWFDGFMDYLRFEKGYLGSVNDAIVENSFRLGLQPEEAVDLMLG